MKPCLQEHEFHEFHVPVHLYDSSSSRELVGEHSIRLFLSFPELLQKLDNDIWRRGE